MENESAFGGFVSEEKFMANNRQSYDREIQRLRECNRVYMEALLAISEDETDGQTGPIKLSDTALLAKRALNSQSNLEP